MQKVNSFNLSNRMLEVENDLFLSTISKKLGFSSFRRVQKINSYSEITDVFVPSWMVAYIVKKESDIFINLLGNKVEVSANSAIFIPPFTPVRWEIAPQTIEWEAFFGELKSGMPLEPFIFDKNSIVSFLNDEIVEGEQLSYLDRIPYVPRKVKDYIDMNFGREFKIDLLSDELSLPKSTINHYFKDCFNITPVAYRNLLRTNFSRFLIIDKRVKPLVASRVSGYSSYSSFKRGFVRNFSSPPRDFYSI